MKNHNLLLLLAALILSLNSALAEKTPSYVIRAFEVKYPNAQNVSWKHSLNTFIAGFEQNNYKYVAQFNNNGEWKKTEQEISLSVLPELVKNALLNSEYANWNIKSINILFFPYIKSKYNVTISSSDNQIKRLLFNQVGKMLKDNFNWKF